MPLYPLAQNSASNAPASMMTRTRRYVDLLAPSPDHVHISDLCAGAEQPRFRNHTARPISIAEHSLRTARIGLAFGEPLEVLLALLLHDAPEAYLVDMPGPIKKHVRVQMPSGALVPWSELEAEWATAICQALLPAGLADAVAGLINAPRGPVHDYDRMALQVEALLWMPGAEDWASEPALDPDPRVWPAAIEHPGWTWADATTQTVAEAHRVGAKHSTELRRCILGPRW